LDNLKNKKIGFIGTGNLAQAIISGILDAQVFSKEDILASNRTDKKLQRVGEKFGIQTRSTNEAIVDECKIVVLAMKPQDLLEALEPLRSAFTKEHLIISLAAGLSLETLSKAILDYNNIAKVMCNVAVRHKKGMMGYSLIKEGPQASDMIHDIFSPLGKIIEVPDSEAMSALTVASAAGIGLVLELMQYWQDWIEGYGYSKDVASMMTAQTFLGAAHLALENPNLNFFELINQVASKKGVTESALVSMRETDVDRVLRISFEKAYMRDRELGK